MLGFKMYDEKILVFHLEVKTSIRGVKEKKEASEPFDLNDVGSLSTVACWVEMLTIHRIHRNIY